MTDTIVFPGTLEQALQSVNIMSGSRLLLHGGDYLVGDMECKLQGVTITNVAGEQAVLVPASCTSVISFQSEAHDIVFDGININAVNVTNSAIKITAGATNITIKNVEIKNCQRSGILITGATTTGTLIDSCHIHHNGTTALDHGIYIQISGTIRNCLIHDNVGYGVHAYSGLGAYIVDKCYIYANGTAGIGALYGTATITNNVIRRNGGQAIRATYDLVNILAAFNTCDSPIAGGKNISAGWRTTNDIGVWRFENNACINGTLEFDAALANVSGDVLNNLGTITGLGAILLSSGNITDAFVPASDDGGANYKPTAGNPAIGAGVAVAGIAADYGGNARNNPPTIGAWE